MGYTYFIYDPLLDRIKIGWSINPRARFRTLKSQFHSGLLMLGYLKGGNRLELQLHQRFSTYRIGRSEWFHAAPIAAEIEKMLG